MYKFKKICSALKNAIGNLIEIALNLWRLLWVVIFTVFILPIQEHSESLHLFVSSLDSFFSVIVFKAQVFCIGLFLCILFSVYTFQEWSIFLPVSLIELLQLNPSGLQSQMFWKLLLPMPETLAGGPAIGLRTLNPMGELL